MISERQWRAILTAPSTSEAVDRAAKCALPALCETPMPCSYDELSSHAQDNARAVSRALDIKLDGVPSERWSTWTNTEEDLRFASWWDDKVSMYEMRALQVVAEGAKVNNESAFDIVEPRRNGEGPSASILGTPLRSAKKRKPNQERTTQPASQSGPSQPRKSVTAEERKAANSIRTWAQQSSHKDAPSEALTIVARSACSAELLKIIVPLNAASTLRATVVVAFSETGGSAMALHLITTLIIPYVNKLKAPASRELMQAIVKFAEVHWRAALLLYDGFEGDKRKMNAAIAEILVRTAASLTDEGSLKALEMFSKSRWGEDGIRVVEALVAKCKEQWQVESILVPSMERNVIGLERSVRFGKLLFMIAKGFPNMSEENRQAMVSIAGRSTAFLAKRAVTMLESKRLQPS